MACIITNDVQSCIEGKKTALVPKDDILLQFSVTALDIFEGLRRFSELETQIPKELKLGKASKFYISPVVVEARRNIIAALLPLRACATIFLDADPNLGPFPYADWIYSSKDTRKICARVFWGNGDLLGYATLPTQVWRMWNSILTADQIAYIDSKHKSNNPDDRLMRGWKTISIFIDNMWYAWETLIPGYYREQTSQTNIPDSLTELLAQISLSESKDSNDSEIEDIDTEVVVHRKSKPTNLKKSFLRQRAEKSKTLALPSKGLFSLIFNTASKEKDSSIYQQQVINKTFGMTTLQLKTLLKMQTCILTKSDEELRDMSKEVPMKSTQPSLLKLKNSQEVQLFESEDDLE